MDATTERTQDATRSSLLLLFAEGGVGGGVGGVVLIMA
jgi:hypothetical protein